MVDLISYDPKYVRGLVPLLRCFETEIAMNDPVLAEAEINITLSELQNGRDEAVLALKEEKVVGFQIGSLYRNDADRFRKAGTFEFSSSYVDKNCRRIGIGRTLKSFFIADLRERPEVSSIAGCIYEHNHASIALHKSLGFRKVGDYSDGAKKYLVFKKSL